MAEEKYIPDSPEIYQGKQVIINSDRLLFNAKDDSILLYSDKAIGLSTNGSIHFDTSDNENSKFIVNTPTIHLGLNQNKSLGSEPAILGEQADVWLNELLDMIAGLIDDLCLKFTLIGLAPGAPTAPNPANKGALALRNTQIVMLRNKIDLIKSKKVFLGDQSPKLGNFIERDITLQQDIDGQAPANPPSINEDTQSTDDTTADDTATDNTTTDDTTTDDNATNNTATNNNLDQENLDSMSFREAFRTARDAGLDIFEWRGNSYNTKTRSEEIAEKIEAVKGSGNTYRGAGSSTTEALARNKAKQEVLKNFKSKTGIDKDASIGLDNLTLKEETVTPHYDGFDVVLIYEI